MAPSASSAPTAGCTVRRRADVSSSYAVEAVVSMHDVDAFEETVSAYPAVTVIRHRGQGTALVATASKAFGEPQARSLAKWAASRRKSVTTKAVSAVKLPKWFDSELSWPSGNPANLALVADLERRLPLLEDTATGYGEVVGDASHQPLGERSTRRSPQLEREKLAILDPQGIHPAGPRSRGDQPSPRPLLHHFSEVGSAVPPTHPRSHVGLVDQTRPR